MTSDPLASPPEGAGDSSLRPPKVPDYGGPLPAWLAAATRDGVFGWLLVLGLALRIAGSFLPGTGDMNAFTGAGIAAADYGTDCYSLAEGPNVPPLNYPPGAYFTCAVAERLARACRFVFPRHFFHNMLMTAFLGCALPAIAGFVRRRRGRTAGRLAVLLIWLSPVVILDSPMLGYMDPVMGAELLLGMLMALQGSWAAAGLLCGLSIATKPTGFILIPILAILAMTRGGAGALARAAAATVGVVLLVFAPFAAAGTLMRALVITAHAFKNDCLSCNGLNLWWLIQWMMRVLERAAVPEPGGALFLTRTEILPRAAFGEATGLPYWAVSMPLVLLASGWIWFGFWRRLREEGPEAAPVRLLEACSTQILAYFAVSHNVHENHLYLVFLLWPVLLAVGPGELWPARLRVLGLLSALGGFNLFYFYGVGDRGAVSGGILSALRPANLPDLSLVVALLLVVAAAVMTWRPFAKISFESPDQEPRQG